MFFMVAIFNNFDYSFAICCIIKLICLVIREVEQSQNDSKYNFELMQKQITEKEIEVRECKLKLEQVNADVTNLNIALEEKNGQVSCLQAR